MKHIIAYPLFEADSHEEIGPILKPAKEELTPDRLSSVLGSLMQNDEFLNWAGKIAVDDVSYRPAVEELIDGYCELVCGYVLFKWPKSRAKGCGLPGIAVDQLIFRKEIGARPHSILRWNLGQGNSDPGARARARDSAFAFPDALYFDGVTPTGVDHWQKLNSFPKDFFKVSHPDSLVYYKPCVSLPKQVQRRAGLYPPVPITLKRLGLL